MQALRSADESGSYLIATSSTEIFGYSMSVRAVEIVVDLLTRFVRSQRDRSYELILYYFEKSKDTPHVGELQKL